MKLITKSLICLTLLSLSVCDFSLAIIGDTGHVKAFQGDPQSKINEADLILENFETVLKSKREGVPLSPLCGKDSQVILGDMVYTEIKAKDPNPAGAFGKLREGWRAFTKSLETWKAQCGGQFNTKNLVFLPGNHMYDVDFRAESQHMNKVVKNGRIGTTQDDVTYTVEFDGQSKKNKLVTLEDDKSYFSTQSPRIEVHKDVVFLDVNIMPIYCAVHKDFTKCFYKSSNLLFNSQKAARAYTHKFIFALKQLAEHDKLKNIPWKVLRAHHAFINTEGYLDNLHQLWSTEFKFKSYSDDQEDTIVSRVQKAGINLMFASHHHTAQLIDFDYTNIQDGQVNKLTDKNNKGPDEDTCYIYKPSFGSGVTDECKQHLTVTYNTSMKPKHLYTFIIGNSGRRPPDHFYGGRGLPDHAKLVWGNKSLGAATAVFQANQAEIQFFTVNDVNKKIDNTLTVKLGLQKENPTTSSSKKKSKLK